MAQKRSMIPATGWEPLQGLPEGHRSWLAYQLGQSLARGGRLRVTLQAGGSVTGVVVAQPSPPHSTTYRLDTDASFALEQVAKVEPVL